MRSSAGTSCCAEIFQATAVNGKMMRWMLHGVLGSQRPVSDDGLLGNCYPYRSYR